MHPLSAYILTHNSKRYLPQIIETIAPIVDEILVIDSGSTDGTKEMVTALPNARLIEHPFENFIAQRNFAASVCSHDHVLFLDSDELADADFIASLAEIKAAGFPHEAYRAKRQWIVMGRPVHCIYPIVSPDGPIRLLDRRKVKFDQTNFVHSSPSGYASLGEIGGILRHITFHDQAELSSKLEQYTHIAAQQLSQKGKPTHIVKALLSAIAAWIKWYIIKGGFRDGWLGLRLSVYAFQYSWKKYRKAHQIKIAKQS